MDSAPAAWRFRVKAGRAVDDPEKLVTPGVLYVSKSRGTVTVWLIAIGWWDWHVSLLIARTGVARAAIHAVRQDAPNTHGGGIHDR